MDHKFDKHLKQQERLTKTTTEGKKNHNPKPQIMSIVEEEADFLEEAQRSSKYPTSKY